jgi:hypothetical protein
MRQTIDNSRSKALLKFDHVFVVGLIFDTYDVAHSGELHHKGKGNYIENFKASRRLGVIHLG